MKKINSIRGLLTSRLLTGLFITYAVLGVIFYQVVEISLTDQFDSELINWVNNISGMFDFEEPDTNNEFQGTVFDDQEFLNNRKYYQVWTLNKKTIARSLSLNNSDLPFFDADLDDYRFENIKLPLDINGRAVVYSFINSKIDDSNIDEPTFQKLHQFIEQIEGKESKDLISEADKDAYCNFLKDHGIKETHTQLTIVLAHSRVWLDKILLVIRLCLSGVGIILIVASWYIIRRSVKTGLLPLNKIAKKTTEIDSDKLIKRFSEEKNPEELMPVVIKLNEMLERLEKAFTREKRFTANVAHELRTPIAELRALAEVGRGECFSDPDEISDYFDDALDIAIQMQNLTESLLTLARIDSNSIQVNLETMNLDSLLRAVLKKIDKIKGKRRFNYSVKEPEKLLADSDRALLSSILTNLITNAVSYSPDGSIISITLMVKHQGFCLSISNVTSNLTEKDLPYIFEPFWRKDSSRSDLSHSGVGLTLVSSCCDLLNISIESDFPKPDTIEFSLFIPEK